MQKFRTTNDLRNDNSHTERENMQQDNESRVSPSIKYFCGFIVIAPMANILVNPSEPGAPST
jgi:hypothetical protein